MAMKPKILLCLALVLSGGFFGCKTACIRESGAVTDGLQISLHVFTRGNSTAMKFNILFVNRGTNDVVLNLGTMLANGKYLLPDKIHLIVTDKNGKVRNFDFYDKRFAAVAGRADPYVVPLRAGSTYSVRLDAQQFSSPVTMEWGIKSEPESISAQFEGGGTEFINSDMAAIKLMNFWKGKLQSNAVFIK
jgi:hypothetical protein